MTKDGLWHAQMTDYVYNAMVKARYVTLKDGSYYADVFLCPGVWATGETIEECRDVLEQALIDWLLSAYEDKEPLSEITDATWINPFWHIATD